MWWELAMWEQWKEKVRLSEQGQGLVEYALGLVLVSIVTIGIVTVTGGNIAQMFCKIISTLQPGDLPSICEQVDVSCAGSKSGGGVSVQAQASGFSEGDE